ncbi:P-II family nitrogen regulator [Oscillibacter sp. MSJ-2]|uniref:P-II family nitrogen regulator n=1 Tax=Dysosmobacter acutus TaxID=2841504 RepID=A0ABS6F728_9FIRM|nr:P-II family nitrogen regulator [Dysosmobacter acutus]MBU5625850.1 P-II family nitrogen regulator [Dysosmobacter acutus]
MSEPRLLFVISDADNAVQVSALLKQGFVPLQYQCRGKGTASSEILRLSGLGESDKAVSLAMIRREEAPGLLRQLNRALHLKHHGTGIAVTIPISGLQSSVLRLLDRPIPKKEEEDPPMASQSAYAMILAAVNQGFSDEVMDAARSAGATGGTVLRGRRRGLEEPMRFFGISLQEEQELILIVSSRKKKVEIMDAIHKGFGPKSPAQGVVLSMPVEDVMGLE